MAIPIVFIHRGYGWYLDLVMFQARRTNPNSPIVLISNRASWCRQFTQFVDIDAYSKRADDFAEDYIHLSPLPLKYELFCIQRWFILADWMKQNKIEKCIYLDSDILLYQNMSKEEQFLSYDLTSLDINGPISGFINDLDRLEEFLSFLQNTYQNKQSTLQADYQNRIDQQLLGGISDMTLYRSFRDEHPGRDIDLGTWSAEGVYDYNFRLPQGFEMEESHKKLIWKNGQPEGYHLETAQWTRFKSLHLQGDHKELIPQLIRPDSPFTHLLRCATFLIRTAYKARNVLLQLRPKKQTN